MKLNQAIAVEKGVKARAKADLTEAYHVAQKAELFVGFNKSYEKINDQGEDLPAEQKRVQYRADELIRSVSRTVAEVIDSQATIDYANTKAKADINLSGTVIIKDVPVTHLMFLEHQLDNLRTFINSLPELDEMDDWSKDDQSGLFKSAATKTHRTKKVAKAIVLYEATKEHPAQAQLVQEDILVGYWNQVKHSGGIEKGRKAILRDRVENLIKAVKFAREEANSIDAEKISIGSAIFEYLLA